MRALVWNGPGSDVSLQDIPKPKAGPGEVVIQVKASGVCRSDVAIARGHMPLKNWPLVLGHQTAGIVAEVGNGVKSLKVGDRVISTIDICCYRCYYCLTGRPNLCRNLKRLGFEVNGSDAEFVLTPEVNVVKLPENVPFEQGAISVDAVASMYHALISQAKIKVGDRVVLLGIGGMGIQAIEMAHISGASVLVTSRNDKRLDFAKKLGAEVMVNTTKQDLTKEVMAYTEGEGADIVVNSIGLSDTMKQAVELVRPGGKIIVIGLMAPQFTVPHMKLVMNEIEITGSRIATKLDVIKVIDLIAADRLHPAVTVSYLLSDFKAGFEAVEKGEIMGRAALIP